MKRIAWIDYGKSLAIFLVVLLHVNCNHEVVKVINGFIMPLFFLMSGYLFSLDRNPSYKAFVAKRFRQLMVPYLWISALAYVAWVTVLRHVGAGVDAGMAWHVPLVGIFAGIPPLLRHDIPLWSLLSFFMAEIIYYPLCRRVRRPLVIAAGALLLTFIMALAIPTVPQYFPLALGPTLCALIFYDLGHYLRARFDGGSSLFRLPSVLIAVVLFIVSIRFNDEISFYTCRYDNFGLFLISSLAGSYLVCYVAYLLGNLGVPSLIKFTSRVTLLICGFHLLVFAGIKGVALYGFGIAPETLTEGILPGICFALVSFFICLGISWLIERYFRFLVDK